jgi:CPA2 family monovalent cation:H+ antiporter-2
MFGVGLHFSIGDLLAVRFIAIPGAIIQMGIVTAIGLGVASAWGWTVGAGLVFGLALSIASTAVLLRVFEARGILQTSAGQIAVGWLVVEDLITVLILVVLPPLTRMFVGSGASSSPAGAENLWVVLGLTVAKLIGFVAVLVVGGTRLFPWILKRVERSGSRELFTLAALVLALGIAFGAAELFGVSLALGAFFAGVVINESELSHRIAREVQPLQDAFAALFFVAVGMLFDPATLVDRPLQVLIVLAIIVLGNSLVGLGVILLLGHPLKTGLTIAPGLAQIGEFSFILAELGVGLQLFPAEASHFILAGALLSITLNPFLFRIVDKIKLPVGERAPVERVDPSVE